MPFVGNTDSDRRLMLEALGLESTDELFADIPPVVRFPGLNLPPPKSEIEILKEIDSLAAANGPGRGMTSFAGAGAYNHFIPSVVSYLSSRGEFTTAYTPYQAEASQGTLQTIFEYQSMLCDLLDMDVVNASHYDGATALAEAALMAVRATRGRERVLFAGSLHPEYLQVAESYLEPQGLFPEVIGRPHAPGDFGPDPASLVDQADSDTAAVVISNPDFFGRMHDLTGLADRLHEKGALLILNVDPIATALFRSPGSLGADIVTGEGQPLGIPLSFGGPYLGIFAARKELVRKIPGRLVGQTTDADGKRGFVLTLNTREQHIRREKATSNICTNQGLMALRAAIYLASMGPAGLREVAEHCYRNAVYAAARLDDLPGCTVFAASPAGPGGAAISPGGVASTPGAAENPDAAGTPFFREFVLSLPVSAEGLIRTAEGEGIIPGVALSRYFPERTNELLVAVTEVANRQEIDRLADVVAAALPTAGGGTGNAGAAAAPGGDGKTGGAA